jgi:hypothetical protein
MLILKVDDSFATADVELVKFSIHQSDFGREQRFAFRIDQMGGDSARLRGEGVDTTLTREFRNESGI